MLVIVTDGPTDLAALAGRLFPGTDSARARESLQRLNPQVDPNGTLQPGAVLFVPEVPGVQREGTGIRDVEGDAFNAFRNHALAAVDAVVRRVSEGHTLRAAEADGMLAVFESAAMRTARAADPDLNPQVEAATAVFKQDQADARAAEEMLRALREEATTELAGLLKLIE